MPRVSICIPAYKADRFLDAALASVARQHFRDWEVIVTEDGSRDRTEEIVRAFARTVEQSVIYNRHDSNRGLPTARNTGIAAAKGEWIAFIDSDDLWAPSHLDNLVKTSQQGDFEMVFAGTQPFDDLTGKRLSLCFPSPKDLEHLPAALFSGRLSILPSATMVRRRCFGKYGPIATMYPHANDTEYWLRILRGGGQAAYTGSTTCLYRKHPGAMSLRATNILTNTAEICERYADWTEIPRGLARERPANLYRYAARSNLMFDPRSSIALTIRSLRAHPFLLRSWVFLIIASLVVAKHSLAWKASSPSKPASVKVS